MATFRQKKAFERTLENGGNVTQAMVDVKYSPRTIHNPSNLTKTKGWQELVAKHLPDSALARRHRELLDKNEVKKTFVHETGEWIEEETGQPDTQAVSKALDMAYKLKGAYAPEKSVNVNVDVEATSEIKAAADRLNALFRGNSESGNGAVPGIVGEEVPDQE